MGEPVAVELGAGAGHAAVLAEHGAVRCWYRRAAVRDDLVVPKVDALEAASGVCRRSPGWSRPRRG